MIILYNLILGVKMVDSIRALSVEVNNPHSASPNLSVTHHLTALFQKMVLPACQTTTNNNHEYKGLTNNISVRCMIYRIPIIGNLIAKIYYFIYRKYDRQDLALEALDKDPEAIKEFSDRLKNDGAFMIKASCIYGDAFKEASDRLKKDKKIVEEVVKSYPNAFSYADESLKNDEAFVISLAIKYSWKIVDLAGDSLKADQVFQESCEKLKRDGVRFVAAEESAYSDDDQLYDI